MVVVCVAERGQRKKSRCGRSWRHRASRCVLEWIEMCLEWGREGTQRRSKLHDSNTITLGMHQFTLVPFIFLTAVAQG